MSIKLNVNGKGKVLDKKKDIKTYLEEMGIDPSTVSIKLNDKTIKTDKLESTLLNDSDNLEFIFFMGGGNLI